MSNLDTVMSITDNIRSALRALGINSVPRAFDDEKSVPASLLPMGSVFYTGERFESVQGQRPSYAEAEYNIKVLVALMSPQDLVPELQRWAHGIREALTVNALNTGGLSESKLVSRVSVTRVDSENRKDRSSLSLKALVRYREA